MRRRDGDGVALFKKKPFRTFDRLLSILDLSLLRLVPLACIMPCEFLPTMMKRVRLAFTILLTTPPSTPPLSAFVAKSRLHHRLLRYRHHAPRHGGTTRGYRGRARRSRSGEAQRYCIRPWLALAVALFSRVARHFNEDFPPTRAVL